MAFVKLDCDAMYNEFQLRWKIPFQKRMWNPQSKPSFCMVQTLKLHVETVENCADLNTIKIHCTSTVPPVLKILPNKALIVCYCWCGFITTHSVYGYLQLGGSSCTYWPEFEGEFTLSKTVSGEFQTKT